MEPNLAEMYLNQIIKLNNFLLFSELKDEGIKNRD